MPVRPLFRAHRRVWATSAAVIVVADDGTGPGSLTSIGHLHTVWYRPGCLLHRRQRSWCRAGSCRSNFRTDGHAPKYRLPCGQRQPWLGLCLTCNLLPQGYDPPGDDDTTALARPASRWAASLVDGLSGCRGATKHRAGCGVSHRGTDATRQGVWAELHCRGARHRPVTTVQQLQARRTSPTHRDKYSRQHGAFANLIDQRRLDPPRGRSRSRPGSRVPRRGTEPCCDLRNPGGGIDGKDG